MDLRKILFIDAATCVLTGLGLAVLAGALEPLLGLPRALLQYAGLALLPVAAFMAWAATRRRVPPADRGLLRAAAIRRSSGSRARHRPAADRARRDPIR